MRRAVFTRPIDRPRSLNIPTPVVILRFQAFLITTGVGCSLPSLPRSTKGPRMQRLTDRELILFGITTIVAGLVLAIPQAIHKQNVGIWSWWPDVSIITTSLALLPARRDIINEVRKASR